MNRLRHGLLIATTLALLGALVSACGSDDGGGGGGGGAPIGPEISYFGLIRADDSLLEPNAVTSNGVPMYIRAASGSGFGLVIEGMPGSNGENVGVSAYDASLTSFPDLVIQASRNLGNGSAQVCDDPITMPGGVPGGAPPSYDETPQNIARINDFACRFEDGAGAAVARQASIDSCVNFEGDFHFVKPLSTVQFCGLIDSSFAFPMGDTTVTTRLRDVLGNLGPEASVIIRVVP